MTDSNAVLHAPAMFWHRLSVCSLLVIGLWTVTTPEANAAPLPAGLQPLEPQIAACGQGTCVIKPGQYAGPVRLTSRVNLLAYGATITVHTGETALTVDPTAAYSTVTGLELVAVGSSTIAGAGVELRAGRTAWRDITLKNFGVGFRAISSATVNLDGTLLERVMVRRSGSYGVQIEGGAANGWSTRMLDIQAACWMAAPGSGCTALRDSSFLSNHHDTPIIHQTQNGGLNPTAPTAFPAFTIDSENARSVVTAVYCERDSDRSLPGPLTTVIGGNCGIDPKALGLVIRPQLPLTLNARHGGTAIVGPTGNSHRLYIVPTTPLKSTAADPLAAGDIVLVNGQEPRQIAVPKTIGLPSAPICRLLLVTAIDKLGTPVWNCLSRGG